MSDAERRPLLDEHDRDDDHEDARPAASLKERVHTALSRPSELNGLERLLAAIAVFLFLLTAVAFGLFAGEAVKYGKLKKGAGRHPAHPPISTVTATPTTTASWTTSRAGDRPTPTAQPGKNGETCMTAECVKVASTVITALDETVDPCQDFYSFANGGWLREHPVPEDKGIFGIAQLIGERNNRIVREVLTQELGDDLPSADVDNIKTLRSFYDSCLDQEAISKQGLKPLKQIVEGIVTAWRGEDLLDDLKHHKKGKKGKKHQDDRWNRHTFGARLTATLSYLHARGIPALFETYLEGDVVDNPSVNTLWLSQAETGLPSKDYYDDDDVVDMYEKAIETTLAELYKALGDSISKPKRLAKAVLKFERKLSDASLDLEELEDPHSTYNRQTAESLAKLVPDVSFGDYFASFTPRPFYPHPVIVTSPAYLRNMTAIVCDAEADVLEAYFLFRASQKYGSLLSSKEALRRDLDKLDNFLSGVSEEAKPSRSDVCLTSLLDNFGFLIGRYYVQKAFNGNSKAYAEDIISATIRAFQDRLPDLDWLDEATRKKAEEKAAAITHKIGYPKTPDTEDPESLKRYYALNGPVKSDDYFGNVVRSQVAEEKRKWARVGYPVDRGIWDMIPSEVNAYYNPSSNEIAFPSGILQAPYFSQYWPEYLAFGSFGSVAGHELTHSVDTQGRQYDKDGRLVDWWTNTTAARFDSLRQCILDQYASYSIEDANGKKYYVKSAYTNGEDMADAGGIGQSFRAWSDRMASDPMGERYWNWLLPGLSQYTREQLFFIAYAQGWARNLKPAEAVKRIRTDPHSPTRYRVIGPLSNSEEFQRAFHCPVGSVMNNKHKCRVW